MQYLSDTFFHSCVRSFDFIDWSAFCAVNSLQTTTLVPSISSNAATIAASPNDGSAMGQTTAATTRTSPTTPAQVRTGCFHVGFRFGEFWMSVVCHLSALLVCARWLIFSRFTFYQIWFILWINADVKTVISGKRSVVTGASPISFEDCSAM